jgi:hypothetical protein
MFLWQYYITFTLFIFKKPSWGLRVYIAQWWSSFLAWPWVLSPVQQQQQKNKKKVL